MSSDNSALGLNSFARRQITLSFDIRNADDSHETIHLGNLHRISATIKDVGMSTGRELSVSIEGLSFNEMNRLSYVSGQPSQDGLQNQNVSRSTVTVRAGVLGNALSTVFVGQVSEAYADYSAAPNIVIQLKARDIAKLEQKVGDQIGFRESMTPSQILSDICARNGIVFADHGGWGHATKLRFSYMNGDVKKQITTLVQAARGFCRFDQHGLDLHTSPSGKSTPNAAASQQIKLDGARKSPQSGAKTASSGSKTAVTPSPTLHAWGPYALAQGTEDETVAEISAASGMIGYPQYAPTGCRLTCIFRPDLSYFSRIRIQSRYLPNVSSHPDERLPSQTDEVAHDRKNPWDGFWTAMSVTHQLSSEVENGPWLTVIACVTSDKTKSTTKRVTPKSKTKS